MGLALFIISDPNPEEYYGARKLLREIKRFRKRLEDYLKDFSSRGFYFSTEDYDSVTNALHEEVCDLSDKTLTFLEPSDVNPYERLMKDKNLKKHFSRLDTALNTLMGFTLSRSSSKTQANIRRNLSRVIKILDSIEHTLDKKIKADG